MRATSAITPARQQPASAQFVASSNVTLQDSWMPGPSSSRSSFSGLVGVASGLGGPFRNSKDSRERERGRKVWVYDLDDNLLEPLASDVRKAFEDADGGELHAKRPGEGNMYALNSSSAAACNLFHYWHARRDAGPIARACRLPSSGTGDLAFEAKFPIDERFRRAPNLCRRGRRSR